MGLHGFDLKCDCPLAYSSVGGSTARENTHDGGASAALATLATDGVPRKNDLEGGGRLSAGTAGAADAASVGTATDAMCGAKDGGAPCSF
jgi:hypothetical protein